ncbi:MAG: hypothetical protein LBK59_00910 [Bifidobacteriaceae bacterium]|nr:hypothetical protein [Bifidobacteriaceae bacterium]
MTYNVITGNGGRYDYSTCAGRLTRRNDCDLPYLPAEDVEEAVRLVWQDERFEPGALDGLKQVMAESLDATAKRDARETHQLDQRIGQVKAERVKWAEQAVDGAVPRDVARAKQAELEDQLRTLEGQRSRVAGGTSGRQHSADEALELLKSLPTAYNDGSPQFRRACNQSWFDCILIDDTETGTTTTGHHTAPVQALRQAADLAVQRTTGDGSDLHDDIRSVKPGVAPATRTNDIRSVAASPPNGVTPGQNTQTAQPRRAEPSGLEPIVVGSSSDYLVAGGGIEPPTSRL